MAIKVIAQRRGDEGHVEDPENTENGGENTGENTDNGGSNTNNTNPTNGDGDEIPGRGSNG